MLSLHPVRFPNMFIATPIIAARQKTFCFPETKKCDFCNFFKPPMDTPASAFFTPPAKPTCLKKMPAATTENLLNVSPFIVSIFRLLPNQRVGNQQLNCLLSGNQTHYNTFFAH